MPRKKTVVVSPAAKSEKYAEVFELEAASHFGAEFVADWAAALGEPEDVIEVACQNALDSVLPALALESHTTLSQAATVFRHIVLGHHGKDRSTRQIGLLELDAGLKQAIDHLTSIGDLDFGPETTSPFDLRKSEDDLPDIFTAIPDGEDLGCSKTDAKQAVLDAHVPLSTRDLLLLLQQVRDLHKKLEAVARQLPKPKLGAKANHIAQQAVIAICKVLPNIRLGTSREAGDSDAYGLHLEFFEAVLKGLPATFDLPKKSTIRGWIQKNKLK